MKFKEKDNDEISLKRYQIGSFLIWLIIGCIVLGILLKLIEPYIKK